jgi:hypothetical protein
LKNPHIITGSGPLITPKMMPQGGDECVSLLEDMLSSARKGEMSWLIVVAGGPNDFGSAFAGNNAAQMNLGLDVAKADIISRVKAR